MAIKDIGSRKKIWKKNCPNFFWLQMSPGQMLHGQLSPVTYNPTNLLLNFGEDLISKS